MTFENDPEPTNTPLHDDNDDEDGDEDEEDSNTKEDDDDDDDDIPVPVQEDSNIHEEEEEEDALALLARSKARMTEVETERKLDEVRAHEMAMNENDDVTDDVTGNENEEDEDVSEEVSEEKTEEAAVTDKLASLPKPTKQETISNTPTDHHLNSVPNQEVTSPAAVAAARTLPLVHLKAKPSNLAEEAAALLAMSKARLMNGETSNNDGAHSSSVGAAAGVEVVKKQSMMIKPLEDDEVIESSSEEEEEEEEEGEEELEEEEVEEKHLEGTEDFETRVSEKSNRGEKDSHPAGADVTMNGHKAKDVVDQNLSNSEEEEEEEEVDDEAIQSQARAYAAAMLTVANVSESHNRRSTHREDDKIKNSVQEEQMEDVKSFVDTKYLNNLDALPPHLINALLHEEAMFAAEKAALEGKDRHVFDLKQASDLSSEVRIFCFLINCHFQIHLFLIT